MAEQPKKYTHVGVMTGTQKKIALLSRIRDVNIYDLVEAWADEAWEKAKKEGLVTDAMLTPAPIKKKDAVSAPMAVTA
jgi:hypothetical protein